VQTTTLIFGCSILTNSYTLWKLRHAFNFTKVWPYALGSMLGVPLGAELLRGADPRQFAVAMGTFLILFCAYTAWKPAWRMTGGGKAADLGSSVLNGVLGGATGLSGIVIVVWNNLRGLPKDAQRSIFAPTVMLTNLVAVSWLGFRGAIDATTLSLFAVAAPACLIGTWAGLKLYGKLDEAGFRRVVIGLLLVSAVVLIA
jgi:uncharacterized membrane protein YfcA